MPEPGEPVTIARLADKPTWLLYRAAQVAGRKVQEGFAAAGARGYHYRLLATLEQYGPASQAELGRYSGIHLSDMVATVNELAADGYVERSPDPTDRRRNIVALTAAGRRRLRRLDKHIAKVQDDLLAGLKPAERRTLVALLDKLLAVHATDPDEDDRHQS